MIADANRNPILLGVAASRLAEVGASDAEIQAITGHKTWARVARYTAGAHQQRLARAAIARLPRTRTERESD